MNDQAWIHIDPLDVPRVAIICRPCGINQPSHRWTTALATARQHNLEHHGTP